MLLGGTAAISTLSAHMPPRLATLCLPRCQLTHTDLDLLATRWRQTLLELNIKHNAFVPMEPTDLHSPTARLAWVENLPPSLRVMDVQGMPVTDGIAMAIAERASKIDSCDRLMIYLQAGCASPIALVLLQTKLDVKEL
ncbi:hypothetical protein GGF32_002008 [Allomyces javanicus]|nr:hypothetical protein GGF32_002008 [Allomyces javanicus]